MRRFTQSSFFALALSLGFPLVASAEDPSPEMLAGLRPFHGLVGSWQGQGTSQKSSGWNESANVTWGYRDKDGRVSINLYIKDGKLIDVALLTYDPESKNYDFIMKDKQENVLRFQGAPSGPQSLRLNRVDEDAKDGLDRIELKLTKGGDKLMYSLGKKKGRTLVEPIAEVEYFREGESLDGFKDGPRCIVTGGAGRVEVMYKDKPYHVACEATKELFEKDPEKYISKSEKAEKTD